MNLPQQQSKKVWFLVILLISSAFSVLATFAGLNVLNAIPSTNSQLVGQVMVFLLSVCISAAIATSLIFMPRINTLLKNPRYWLMPVLFPSLMVFSVFTNLFGLSYNSRGEQLLAEKHKSVLSVMQNLINAEAAIHRAVQTKLKNYQQLERAAREGRDESNIAECGPRCKKYIRKATHLQENFGVLLLPPAKGLTMSGDTSAMLMQVTSLRSRLMMKREKYQQYARVHDPKDESVTRSVNEALSDYENLMASIPATGINKENLALNNLNIFQWKIDIQTGFLIFLAFIPELVNLVMGLALRSLWQDSEYFTDMAQMVKKNRLALAVLLQELKQWHPMKREYHRMNYSEKMDHFVFDNILKHRDAA